MKRIILLNVFIFTGCTHHPEPIEQPRERLTLDSKAVEIAVLGGSSCTLYRVDDWVGVHQHNVYITVCRDSPHRATMEIAP